MIRPNGPRLGRLPKDRQEYLEALKPAREKAGERNETGGCIGASNRRYGLDPVMMRLNHIREADIHAVILAWNLFK